MSYVHRLHNEPLEHRTPFQLLHAHAKVHPNKEAFVFRNENLNRTSLTFKEYDYSSRLLAASFLEIGLVHSDRVLVMLPSCPEFLLVHMALNRIGANIIIIEEGSYPAVLGIANLACVIARTDIDMQSINNQKVMENIQIGLREDNLKAVVVVSPNAGPLKDCSKVFVYKELLEMAETKPDWQEVVQLAESMVQMDDPTFVIFTSGSTAIPKPIQYTNFGYVNGSFVDASVMMMDENSILFSDAPFDWISGLFFSIGAVITKGTTLVAFPPKISFKGGLANTTLKVLEDEKCTHAVFLGYLVHDIISKSHPVTESTLSRLKHVMTGGQAFSVPLFKQFLEMFPHLTVINAYGATELNLLCSERLTKDTIDTTDVGLMDIVCGVEVKIVDNDGRLVPHETKGEVCVRSSWVSFPDWDIISVEGKPATSGNGKNGWHFTNDAASMDKDGKLRLQGRLDDMIKCATESIAPYDVENLLLEHPYVKKACVVGVPDQRIHEKICACIILKDGIHDKNQSGIENELEKWCSDNCWESNIGLLCKPHYYIFVNEFPLTRTGKLSRRLVREMAITKLEFS